MKLSTNNKEEITKICHEKQLRFGFRKLASGALVSAVIGGFVILGTDLNVQASTDGTADSTIIQPATTSESHNNENGLSSSIASGTTTTNTVSTVQDSNSDSTSSDSNSAKSDVPAGTSTADQSDHAQDQTTSEDKTNENTSQLLNSNLQQVTNTSNEETSNQNSTQVNIADWTYTKNGNNVTLNGYHGTIQNGQLIVPNAYDFSQAGIITNDGKVWIERYLLQQIAKNNAAISEIDISSDGDGKVTAVAGDWGNAFFNLTNIKKMDLSHLDTSDITNMSLMFYGDNNLTDLNLTDWDTSKNTSMYAMFTYDNNLVNLQGLSNWDTSKVTNMQSAFYGVAVQNLDLSNWNTSNVTNMHAMFMYASHLISAGNLDNWDTSNVTDMAFMFYNANALSNVGDLSRWQTGKVTNMASMFRDVRSLKSPGNLDNWDVSNVTDMSYMFGEDNDSSLDNQYHSGVPYEAALTSVGDLSHWDTSKVTNMEGMFRGDANLRTVGNLANWQTGNVTNMAAMFLDCYALTTPGNLDNWDVSNVTDMNFMFGMIMRNGALTSVGDLFKWNTSKVYSLAYMFDNDSNLTTVGDLSNWDVYNVGNYPANKSGYDFAYMFAGTNINSLGDLSKWNVGNAKNFTGMFMNNSSLTDLGNLGNWNMGNATTIRAMFAGDSALTNIGDLSNWNLSNNTDTTYLFYNTQQLKTVGDMSNWDMHKVTSSQQMFYWSGIRDINISNWDLSNDQNVSEMFAHLVNPAVITMTNTKLPTATKFKLSDFVANERNPKPLVVYSNDPALLALNNEQHNGVTCRQDTNKIKLHNDKLNLQVTVPMDFVYSNRDALVQEFQSKTTKDQANATIHSVAPNYNVSDSSIDPSTGSLYPDYEYIQPDNVDHVDDSVALVTNSYSIDATYPVTDGRTVIRTINVTYPDGTTQTIRQVVTLTCNGTRNTADGTTNWGDWTTGNMAAYDVPQIAGYSSYIDGVRGTVIPEITVNADTQDQTINVNYTKNAEPVNPVDPVNPNDPNHTITPSTPSKPGSDSSHVNQPSANNNDKTTQSAKRLPQTGNNSDDIKSVGLLIPGMLAMFGLAGLNRKRKE